MSEGISMFKSTAAATQSICAVVAASALVAGAAVFLTSAMPEAKADSAMQTKVASAISGAHPAFGAQMPARAIGAACSSQSWPNYDQSCKFDLRRSAGEARPVRVIALR